MEIESIRLIESWTLISSHLENDFDTPAAIAEVLKISSSIKTYSTSDRVNPNLVAIGESMLVDFLSTFGFVTGSELASQTRDDALVNLMVEFRSQIRRSLMGTSGEELKRSLWNSCDSLRNSLKQYGIQITDSKHNSTWYRGFD